MNYHAFSYDIAHLEHDSRVRSGELHGGRRYRHRHRRRKRSSPDTSSNATSA